MALSCNQHLVMSTRSYLAARSTRAVLCRRCLFTASVPSERLGLLRDCRASRHLFQREHWKWRGVAAEAYHAADDEAFRHEGVPVVLLSGFLGAGKTTVLENLLRGDHGLRLGVIVNDLASVNVDAMVLEGAAKMAGARRVELSNGCVCCSSSGELRKSILELTQVEDYKTSIRGECTSRLDGIFVELSGIAEPLAAKAALKYLSAAFVARTITVVDSPAFATDILAEVPQSMQSGSDAAPEERVSALLAEQIEHADLILLNKADLATKDELQQTEALARAMNLGREVQFCITEHGRVAADLLLPRAFLQERRGLEDPAHGVSCTDERGHVHDYSHTHSQHHDHDSSHTHDEDCSDHACSDPTHDHRPSAERRFGIRSFVYTSTVPFSRHKLVIELQRWQQQWTAMGRTLVLEDRTLKDTDEMTEPAGESSRPHTTPLEPVLRSKGLVWTDTDPDVAYYWSHAGRMLRLSFWGLWTEDSASLGGGLEGRIPDRETPGAARNEIVFIGAGVDEIDVRKLLDSCLLTTEEFAALQAERFSSAEGRG